MDGYQRQNCGSPQLVGMPTTLNCSLTVIGKPSSGRRSPFARAASAAAAASRARSKSRTTTALIFGSVRSMRKIAASTSSREETSLPASASTSSPAVR